jgi:inorganic pyrophosphatase
VISKAFWQALQELLSSSPIMLDRPAGQPHPHYPELVYPLDYGFLENTISGDGDGLDVWVGSLNHRKLTGILCTFDTVKHDAEIKLLTGCSAQDVQTILNFNDKMLHYLYIPNPEENT